MNPTFEADAGELSTKGMLSVFSGLAVLCILVAVLFASTCIASGEGAQAPSLKNTPPGAFQADAAPVPSVTFFLLDSEAQLEEIREWVELAADQVAQIPLQAYPHVVTLLAHTPDEETLAYARVVEEVRISKGEPLSIEVIDLRAQKVN